MKGNVKMKPVLRSIATVTALLAFFAASAHAATNTVDPCLSGFVKSSAPFSLISSEPEPSVVVVPGIAGKSTYVCGMLKSGIGGTSMHVASGTGSVCGTGTDTLTGSIIVPLQTANGNNGTFGVGGVLAPGTLLKAPTGNDLCLIFESGQSISGFITFVQQ
jgi:hypothetical protein